MEDRYDKYYDFSSSLVVGITFIVVGIILLVGKEKLYKDIVSIVVFILLLISLFNFIKYLSKNRTSQDNSNSLIVCIFNLFGSFIFMIVPRLSFGLLPFLFSIYLVIIGISNFIMYLLLFVNKSNNKIRYLVGGSVYLGIALPILISPVSKINTFIICLSIYIIMLGARYVTDFIVNIMPVRTKNKIKRHIRITLPKLMEAIIPYSVMVEINRSLEVSNDYKYVESKDEEADMDIIIHTSNRGFNRMGHIDICFDGKVISYGNYDEGSRWFKNIFGDGVMFLCDKEDKYINFCIEHSKKTVFVFGIKLTDRQKDKVRKRIDELFSCSYSWDHKSDKKYNDGDSYAGKLYKKTRAKFYKFKSGKYKTYYVLGTNCCYLADDIVGKSGLDILSLNGIITPGTYYDYLNKELHRKNSIVVSKNIYNASRKAKFKK